MNNIAAVEGLQATLASAPEEAHKGTIAACLSYRAFPEPGDRIKPGSSEWDADEKFFLDEAMRGDSTWYGKLMADHTALDWRDSIAATFGPGSESKTEVLVITSSRSGCFPAAGPLAVVGLVNGPHQSEFPKAKGVAVAWGGHWCYWEDPARFNKLCLQWLEDGELFNT